MGIFTDKIKTAIEIRETEIKIVQVAAEGPEVKIMACVTEEIPPNDIKSAAARLQQILKKFKIKSKNVILAIPRQFVTTRTVDLPSHDLSELEDMAGFQAIKQIPYPKEEIFYGVYPIEMAAEGYSKVMLVICHKDMIERPIAILKSCGLNPSKVTLSSCGILNWFKLDQNLKEASSVAPLILIECDKKSTDIVIADKERMIYTRGLTFGTSEGTNYFGKLDEEISKTLSTFEREIFALKPTLAVFTGDISILAGHRDFLERSMGIKIEFVDQFNSFPSGMPERFKPFLEKSSFSSLIGSAVGPDEIDLLPRKMKTDYSARSKRDEIIVSVSLAMAVAILFSLVALNKLRQKEESLKILEGRLRSINPAAQEVGRMKAVTDIVRSETKNRSLPLAILNELYRITPSSINLTLYKYEEGALDIKGTASVLSEVFRFVKLLDDSTYFQNVEVRYAAKRKVQEIEIVDFEIVCPLAGQTKTKR